MARKFMRRRPSVVWLPIFGTDFSDGEGQYANAPGLNGTIAVPNDGTFVQDVQPVTFDYTDSATAEEDDQARSLQDLTAGNEWRLRRVVGKFHAAACTEAVSGTELPTIDLAAAFIVLKTDDSGNPERSAAFYAKEGPLAQDGAENPWIWRRRWILTPWNESVTYDASNTSGNILSALAAINATLRGNGRWPSTTAGYHSVADGPHIDQKTARRIGRQERLYFWLTARAQDNSDAVAATINYQLDYRLLGSLRGAKGNRRNASR